MHMSSFSRLRPAVIRQNTGVPGQNLVVFSFLAFFVTAFVSVGLVDAGISTSRCCFADRKSWTVLSSGFDVV